MIENLPREALLVGGSIGAAALVAYLTRFRPRWPLGLLGKKPLGFQNITSKYHDPSRASHSGTDIGVPIGTPVRSVASGRVHYVGLGSESAGNYVEVDHRNAAARMAGLPGYFSRYLHLDSPSVKTGEFVFRGEEVGKSGNTGYSTGPHLHLEFRRGSPKDGKMVYQMKPVNPEWYLPGWKGYLRKTLIAGSIFGAAYLAAKQTGALK